MALYFRELADLTLRPHGWGGRIFFRSRETCFAGEFLRRISPKRNDTEIFMSLTEPNTVEQLMFLPEDSHASRSPLPGSKEAKTMTVTSGLRCSELSGRLGHVGLLARTLLESSSWRSTRCFLTWKMKATPQKRLLFQLAPLTRPIGAIESGLLPTMRARLTGDITENRKHDKNRNLERVLAELMLPTPKSQDWKGETQRGPEAPMDGIQNALSTVSGITKGDRTGAQTGLKLQPAFVEYLMGFPENWTELTDSKPSEMQSSPKLPTRSSSQLKKRSGFGD